MNREQLERWVQESLASLLYFSDKKHDNPSQSTQKIPIEVSARHIHLSASDYSLLFPQEPLESVLELSQPQQYLSNKRLKLLGPKGIISEVAILAPLRSKTQIELSASDCRQLGINAPINLSGDLRGASDIHLQSKAAIIKASSSLIIAKRHLHMHTSDAERFGVLSGDKVDLQINSKRPLVFTQVDVRVDNLSRLTLHIDTDEGNAAGFEIGNYATVYTNAKSDSSRGSYSIKNMPSVFKIFQNCASPALITENYLKETVTSDNSEIHVTGKILVTPAGKDILAKRKIKIYLLDSQEYLSL